jgi:hypothetical protein
LEKTTEESEQRRLELQQKYWSAENDNQSKSMRKITNNARSIGITTGAP